MPGLMSPPDSAPRQFPDVGFLAPDAAEIAARAAQIRFWYGVRRGIVTGILLFFAGLGYLAGAAWFGAVFSFLWISAATGKGFRKGARMPDKPKKQTAPSLPA